MISRKVQENITVETSYKINILSIENPRAERIDAILAEENVEPAVYHALLEEMRELCEAKVYVAKNLIVEDGREVISRLLAGDTTYTGEITRGALGTGTVTPAAGDTQLGAEVARKGIGTRTRIGTTINLDFYYSKSDTNGTYEEFGLFIDGTDTADSGQLFSRLLTGGWTKTSSESMTVSVQIDINVS